MNGGRLASNHSSTRFRLVRSESLQFSFSSLAVLTLSDDLDPVATVLLIWLDPHIPSSNQFPFREPTISGSYKEFSNDFQKFFYDCEHSIRSRSKPFRPLLNLQCVLVIHKPGGICVLKRWLSLRYHNGTSVVWRYVHTTCTPCTDTDSNESWDLAHKTMAVISAT